MIDAETITGKLAEIVGATHVSSAPADIDAYGGLEPLLVVWPGAAAEVARVLKVASELGVAVGVCGCGTRATRHWPVRADRPRVALDTRRMMNILEVDEVSLTVNCQAGIQLRHLEEALDRHGMTLGPYPPALLQHTLGGMLAAPHPMAHSPRTGWLADACLGLSVAHADGSVIHTRVAPRRATGPDLARLYIGSRGSLGVITTAVLKVHRRTEHQIVTAHALPSFAAALAAARDGLAQGLRPARLRALGAEQAIGEFGAAQPPLPAVLAVVHSGPPPLVAAERALLAEVLRGHGGSELSSAMAQRWWARHSATVEAADPSPALVGARVLHSRLPELLGGIPRAVQRKRLLVWAEQITAQGATLWFSIKGGPSAMSALRSALLNAGLDPLRLSFPPLHESLRKQLDPHEALVVMEA